MSDKDPRKIRTVLEQYKTAPDNFLDLSWRPKIESYLSQDTTVEEDVKFLRNILDACVAFAHSASFTIVLFREILEDAPPESKEEAKTRRMEAFPEYYSALYGNAE